jgi:hypothetical protein
MVACRGFEPLYAGMRIQSVNHFTNRPSLIKL